MVAGGRVWATEQVVQRCERQPRCRAATSWCAAGARHRRLSATQLLRMPVERLPDCGCSPLDRTRALQLAFRAAAVGGTAVSK